ncbi:MAG: response regulator, partial [Actinobacteria bacterium]|nr:response regulator [Actinomycetota bacterium]
MGANISVMVVDDSKQFRDSVRTMLEFEKDIVVSGEAEDGLQAVEFAKRIKPDVILMDVNMPGMDGIAATKAIMAEVSTNVVMVSVQGESDYLRRAMQAGARDYLVKPFGYDDVVAAIRNAARAADLASLYGRQAEKQEKAGKLVTVFSTKGGVGKTTIAANLAVSLRLKSRGKVAVADLDLEFGVMTTMFGIRPDTSIVDLCRVDGPLRAELVERVMIPCSGRLVNVLPAPPSPER